MKKSAIDTALYFLKFRPRSEFEVTRKLKRKKFSSEDIEKTVSALEKQGFLNDSEFAKIWVRNRNLLRPTGKKLLFLELRKLGVESEIIEKALAEEDMEEIDKAEIVFNKKKKYLESLPKDKFRKKMIGILSRRGFNWDVIKEILNRNEG
jgi:regulatory protein